MCFFLYLITIPLQTTFVVSSVVSENFKARSAESRRLNFPSSLEKSRLLFNLNYPMISQIQNWTVLEKEVKCGS